MTILYILAGLCVALSVPLAALNNRKIDRPRLLVKIAASLVFCLVGLLAAVRRAQPMNTQTVLMLCALVLGLAGDIVLGMDRFIAREQRNFMILAGGTPFFLGHFLYIGLLLSLAPLNLWLLPLLLFMPVLFLSLHKSKAVVFGKMLAPLMIYALLLGVMLLSTLNLAVRGGPLGRLMIFPGILFTISDASLFIGDFGNERVKRHAPVFSYLVSVPYYAAQALFALSVVYL